MTTIDNNSDEKKPLNWEKIVHECGIPWPSMVLGYLVDHTEGNTRRNYLGQLRKWLPYVQSHDLKLVKQWELLNIRREILGNGLSDEDQRQALAAMRGFFLHVEEQFRFRNLPLNYIEEVYGSEREYQRRKRERWLESTVEEPLDE